MRAISNVHSGRRLPIPLFCDDAVQHQLHYTFLIYYSRAVVSNFFSAVQARSQVSRFGGAKYTF